MTTNSTQVFACVYFACVDFYTLCGEVTKGVSLLLGKQRLLACLFRTYLQLRVRVCGPLPHSSIQGAIMETTTRKQRQDSNDSQKSVEKLKKELHARDFMPSLSATSASYAPVDNRRGLSFDELKSSQTYYSCK